MMTMMTNNLRGYAVASESRNPQAGAGGERKRSRSLGRLQWEPRVLIACCGGSRGSLAMQGTESLIGDRCRQCLTA